jgi:hypothetical protein
MFRLEKCADSKNIGNLNVVQNFKYVKNSKKKSNLKQSKF